jgi:hypothetical protein
MINLDFPEATFYNEKGKTVFLTGVDEAKLQPLLP